MTNRQSEMVIRPDWVVTTTGWFFLMAGLGSLAFTISEVWTLPPIDERVGLKISDPLGYLLGGGLTIVFFLLGIWLVGMTTKIVFDQDSQYLTITRGKIPMFLPDLRIKRIKKVHAAWVNPISRSQAPVPIYNVRKDRKRRKYLDIPETDHSRTETPWFMGCQFSPQSEVPKTLTAEYEVKIGDLKVVNMGQNKAKAEEWVRWIEEIVQQ